jgi:hypothetical protein
MCLEHYCTAIGCNLTQARDIVDQVLTKAMHAMRITVTTTFGSMPGALTFSQNIVFSVLLIVDWQTIMKHHEQYVNDKPHHVNWMQHLYENALGQQVLKQVHDPTKLGERTTGPMSLSKPITMTCSPITANRKHPYTTRTLECKGGLWEAPVPVTLPYTPLRLPYTFVTIPYTTLTLV